MLKKYPSVVLTATISGLEIYPSVVGSVNDKVPATVSDRKYTCPAESDERPDT